MSTIEETQASRIGNILLQGISNGKQEKGNLEGDEGQKADIPAGLKEGHFLHLDQTEAQAEECAELNGDVNADVNADGGFDLSDDHQLSVRAVPNAQ